MISYIIVFRPNIYIGRYELCLAPAVMTLLRHRSLLSPPMFQSPCAKPSQIVLQPLIQRFKCRLTSIPAPGGYPL